MMTSGSIIEFSIRPQDYMKKKNLIVNSFRGWLCFLLYVLTALKYKTMNIKVNLNTLKVTFTMSTGHYYYYAGISLRITLQRKCTKT